MNKTVSYIVAGILLLSAVISIIFYYNKQQGPVQIDAESFITEENVVYEVRCNAYDNNNKVVEITALLYEISPAIPEDYFGTIEERALRAVENAANKNNLTLPIKYEDSIMIGKILK